MGVYVLVNVGVTIMYMMVYCLNKICKVQININSDKLMHF